MADSIDIQRTGPEGATVVLRGEHDAYTAGRLDPELSALLAESRSILVDLRNATFLDSATVAALLNASQEAEQLGLGLRLLLGGSTGHSVRRLLELTRLYELVPTSEDVTPPG